MREVVLAAPRCAAQENPVGGAVTGSSKTLRIDEGLGEPDRVLIHALPVAGQCGRHAAENVRGKMRRLDPRQNQEACIVRDKSDVAFAGLLAPADETISAP